LANYGIKALEMEPALGKGLNVQNHQLVHPAVREVFPDLAKSANG
jgi:alanine dehydrogenase